MTVSWGGGPALSGSECSICGSMARRLIVHPHFLHLTTQALGSPKFRPVFGKGNPQIRSLVFAECCGVSPRRQNLYNSQLH